MQMGPVAAVRDNSPAAKAGLQPRDDAHGTVGDIITQAEVSEANGQKTRWVFSGTLTQEPGVTVGYLDPAKLPYELTQWAKRTPGPKKVTLTVLRQVDHGSQRVPLVLDWDDHWKFDFDIPLYLSSPWAIPELGLAYRIKNFVEDVTKDSPAARAGLERNDLVKAIRFRVAASESDSSAAKWEELEPDQWANVFWLLQRPDLHDISIRVERAGQSLEMELSPEPDKSWPMVDRGLITQPEVRLQRASNLFEAVALGMQRTERIIMMIYLNLRAIATNRVSPKLVGGPISIARIAYESADQSIYQLILFLGMISVNLAVINFLPIPILDGGHMVFLIYEKLRGAPASESVRVIATYAGLAVIVGLMIFVFWVDIGRLF